MRKYNLIGLVVGIISCLSFTACNLSSNNSNDSSSSVISPQTQITIFSPYVISFGSFISWESVNNAQSYDIYDGSGFLCNTQSTSYSVGDLTEDMYYYVIAKNDEQSVISEKSNIVTVSKTTGFTDDEILDLTDYNLSGQYVIDPNIRKVICTPEDETSYTCNFVITSRTADLQFEFANLTIFSNSDAVISTENGVYSRVSENWNLILNISQTCTIEGIDRTDVPDQPSANSEETGEKGYDGVDCIVAPTVIIRGDGELYLTGGDGGQGGNGADSDGFWSMKYLGDGGDGGDGGSCIICSYLILDMGDDSIVVLRAGSGGKGGNPGVAGSVINGFDFGSEGITGADGTKYKGTLILLGGQLL